MEGRLSGKVAIVTGATSGIGRAIAIRFAREGARVIATGRNPEQGAETVRRMTEAGGSGQFMRHEVSAESDWAAVIGKALADYGKLDIVVNNAGNFFVKPIEETTAEDWDKLWSVNVEGAFLGTKLGMQAMKDTSTGGSIINMSSLMGQVGLENATAYCAAKGAVTHLTKAAAVDGAQSKPWVRVNSLHPGVIWTEMLVHEYGHVPNVKEFLIEQTPMKRLGTPDDIANAALYLASDASRFVTGTEVTIDGGRGAD